MLFTKSQYLKQRSSEVYDGERQPTACAQNAHSCRRTALSRTHSRFWGDVTVGEGWGVRDAAERDAGEDGADRAFPPRHPDYSSQRARARAGLQPGHKLFPATEMCAVRTGDALETNPVSTLTFSLPLSSQFWACVPKSLSSLLGLSP